MPWLPSCVLDPIRVEFLASLPEHIDTHPLGCPNPRISDEVVFDHLIEALVTDCGDEPVADSACSATAMRRRRDEWITLGIFAALTTTVLAAYQRMVGLDLNDPGSERRGHRGLASSRLPAAARSPAPARWTGAHRAPSGPS